MRRLVIALALACLAAPCAACAAVDAGCAIIHAADEVCAIISVPNPDGGAPEQVKVSGRELRVFANERAAAHKAAAAAASADGGSK